MKIRIKNQNFNPSRFQNIIIETQIYKASYFRKKEMNKNMAQYSTFEGKKANKKIVQSPGGNSGFSLGWNYEPTFSSENNGLGLNNINERFNSDQRSNMRYQDYSQPMMVMNDNDNYRQQPLEPYNNQVSKIKQEKDQIDLAMKARQDSKSNKRIPEQYIQENQRQRPSIRVNPTPRQNLILGDNTYNYWKDSNTKLENNPSYQTKFRESRQIDQVQLRQMAQNKYKVQEKPSIRVANPPGGRQTFNFS